MDWMDVAEKLPEDKSMKEIQGIFFTKGFWDKENNVWQVQSDEKSLLQVRGWKEIEKEVDNGSTEG
jgi:hypothetical protein